MSKVSLLLGLSVGLVLVGVAFAATAKFDELFQPSWASDHFIHEGDLLKLKLDNYSGNPPFHDDPRGSNLVIIPFMFFAKAF